jgi:tetratricopeptide (TPR) repeat protein
MKRLRGHAVAQLRGALCRATAQLRDCATPVAVAAAFLLVAAPLPAQRGAAGRVTPGSIGFPRPGFINPGVIERRPVVPMHIGPIPFPPERQWLRFDTPHFILLSAIGENGTRAVAHDLEKIVLLLTSASPYFQLPERRTRVFLFTDRRNVQPYFDSVMGGRVDASGITLRHPRGSTMLIDTSTGGGLTPRHELVHDLLHRDYRPLPLWIEEGLAEYYSNAGLPVSKHVSRLRGRLRMPLQAMFETKANDPRAWTFDYYAQSWAAVATLMRRDAKAFFEFLGDLDRGAEADVALRERYRFSTRDLEIGMRKAGAPAASLLLFSAPPVAMETKPITRAELLAELAELLARVQGREGEAERHFRAAIDTDSSNGAIHLAYSELLLALANRAVDARVEAQCAIDHAVQNEPRALAVIGMSYLAANDAATARTYLERAHNGAPDWIDVLYPLFGIYVDAGERELADRIFTRIADTPRGNQARQRLLDTDIPRADALARDGKLLEAAKILRDLATKMPEKTRANLETQAARLENIAASPQQ